MAGIGVFEAIRFHVTVLGMEIEYQERFYQGLEIHTYNTMHTLQAFQLRIEVVTK